MDRARWRDVRRVALAGLAVVSVVTAGLSLLRFVAFDSPLLHLLVPLAPTGLAVSLLATFLLTSGAVRLLGAVVVVAASLAALPGTVLPRTGCNGRTALEQVVVVYSHNVSHVAFDAEKASTEITDAGADIVLLQEADAAQVEALNNLLDSPFLHTISGSGERTLSLSLLSRWPIDDVVDSAVDDPRLLAGRWTEDVNPMLFASVQTPAGPLRLANVHLSAPREQALVERRRVEVPVLIDQLAAWTQSDDSGLVPDLMMGDFNASGSHADLRRLMDTADYLDGHRLAGCGLGATWSPKWSGPGVLALDHALIDADTLGRTFDVETFRTHGYSGSDHRAISVVLTPVSSG